MCPCVIVSVWGYSEAALPPTPGLCRLVVGPWQGEPELMWFARSSVLATPQGSVLRIKQVLVWFSQPPSMEQIVSWNRGIIIRAVWKPRGREPNLLRLWPDWASGILNRWEYRHSPFLPPFFIIYSPLHLNPTPQIQRSCSKVTSLIFFSSKSFTSDNILILICK